MPRRAAAASHPDSPVLFPAEAAAYLRVVAEKTLERWRVNPPKGGGPRYVKAGGSIGYLREELDRWLRVHQRRTTSDDQSERGMVEEGA